MNSLKSSVIEFNIREQAFKDISIESIDINSDNPDKIYWIHLNLTNEPEFQQISKKIHLPDYLVQMFQEIDYIPKLIDGDDALTIKIQCLLSDELNEYSEAEYGNLIFYLTDSYCLTASHEALPALQKFVEMYPKAIRYAKTPCFILFLVLDNSVNDYSKLLLDFELTADKVDLEIRSMSNSVFGDIMDLKRQVLRTKRSLAIIRDILMRISGRKISVISEQCRLSLDNLLNHSQMIINEADLIRDILNSSLEQIDNSLMQKMNKTMKVLTSFASIFLPLTLIAGIYGMNFQWIPELQWKYGYFWALGLMVACGGVMLYLFKKFDWF